MRKNNQITKTHKSFPFTNSNIAQLIGICGPTRSGKVLICKLVASLKNYEKVNVDFLWEQATLLFSINQIREDVAIYLLRRGISIMSYNLAIGREINFKRGDFSSIYSYQKPSIYFDRARFTKEGGKIFKNNKVKKMNIPIMIHWGITFSKLLFKSFSKIKLIRMVKNPIEIAYSWAKKDYGGNHNTPRVNTLTIRFRNKVLPFYAYGWEKKYLKLSKINRIVFILNNYIKKENKIYNNLSKKEKKKIYTVNFDLLCCNPSRQINRIEKFLKAKKTKFTERVLRQEKLPRKVDKNLLIPSTETDY